MIGMNSNNNSPFWYLDLWRNPIPRIEFPKDEVVIKSEPINVPLWGSYRLRIPQNIWAVLSLPTNGMNILSSGFYRLNLLPGLYELFYIDAQHRVIDLQSIAERAKDNWNVRMNVKIICQVVAPEKVVLMQHPFAQFSAACEAEIKNYIRTKLHDDLVPAAGEMTVDRSMAAEQLRTAINSSNLVEGFSVLKAVVLSINGDPSRLETIDKANAEKTELDQQSRLIEKRREVAIETVKTERLTAQERLEQQLRQAEINAEVADKLWKSKFQQIQLALITDNREIQLEKIKVMEKAFEAVTEILMRYQMQGVTRNGDATSIEALARAMEGMVNTMDRASATNICLLPENANTQPPSLMEILANETQRASQLPYVHEIRLIKNGKNCIDAEVRMPGYEMTICCKDDYRKKGPHKVHIINDAHNEYDLQEVQWNGSSQLSDVVNQFTGLLMAGKVKFNGHKPNSVLPHAE